jgi:osmotically-inducible protein OsmY
VRAARTVPGVGSVDDRLEVKLLDYAGQLDADTKAAVTDALIGDSELHTADVDIEVEDGRVTLGGVVAYASQRERAERLARTVGGVTGVENRLRVLAAISADEVAERISDAIGGADRVTVSVRDGDVILTGCVSSPQDRDAALAAAANSPGVADVHDELSVRG